MENTRVHQVSRYKSSVEQHCKKNIKTDHTPARQIFQREGICQQRGQHDIQECPCDRHDNRDSVCPEHIRSIFQDKSIGIKTQLLWKEGIAVPHKRRLRSDGRHEQQQKRQHDADRRQSHHDMGQNLKSLCTFTLNHDFPPLRTSHFPDLIFLPPDWRRARRRTRQLTGRILRRKPFRYCQTVTAHGILQIQPRISLLQPCEVLRKCFDRL